MNQSIYKRRIALLKEGLKKHGLEALFVTNETNVSYLSGFAGHDSMLLITPHKNYFITDSRYIEDARSALEGFAITLVTRSTYETLLSIIIKDRLRLIGFEAMHLSYGVAAKLNKLCKTARFLPTKDLIEALRSIKDETEIRLIKDSVRLNKKIFAAIVKQVRPGVPERAIAALFEIAYLNAGARPAFDPIVACCENASKPHAIPTDKPIPKNGFVMIDIGARVKSYCSDLTRMVILGNVSERFRKVYDVVRVAHDKAIAKIRPGVKLCAIDAAARGHIQSEGFGKYFGHSLGHGVGMSVHEKPTVSSLSEGVAMPGMIFTIEPAVYLPRFGGVRIEDMVLVTARGCEVLTR